MGCVKTGDVVLPFNLNYCRVLIINAQLGFPVTRVFNNMGGEYKEIELLRTGDVVFASGGEDFLGIDYSRSADDDYEEEIYDAPAGW